MSVASGMDTALAATIKLIATQQGGARDAWSLECPVVVRRYDRWPAMIAFGMSAKASTAARVRAVDDVSLEGRTRANLAIVCGSGSGKTTRSGWRNG